MENSWVSFENKKLLKSLKTYQTLIKSTGMRYKKGIGYWFRWDVKV